MYIVQIVLHQGLHAPDTLFDYLPPKDCAPEEIIGKRVQVPLGSGQAEGIAVGIAQQSCYPNIRQIDYMMDEEPVLSAEMLELARWMANYYVCSLSSCIKLMIPVLLNRKRRSRLYLSASMPSSWARCSAAYPGWDEAFFTKVQKNGILPEEAEQQLGKEVLQDLLQKRILIPGAMYFAGNQRKNHLVYRLTSDKEELLSKRAVKQQQLFAWLQQQGEIPVETVKASFSSAVIQALLDKQLIECGEKSPELQSPPFILTPEQQAAIGRICAGMQKQIFREMLLYGVTGSGKTEVYIRAILNCLAKGKNAMLLVPEITLAQQVYHMLQHRIPGLALFHSEKSDGERYTAWKRVKDGEARVVIGARSALFAPLKNIGLLILDEEQESSYKSETIPCYHAVEVARYRMQQEKGILLLGTATPTLESVKKVLEGKIEMISLLKRISPTPQPLILIENLRRSRDMMSNLLKEKIQDRLLHKEQVLLFMNRRGYAPRIVCMSCGAIQTCPHCSVALVYHQADASSHCHYCGYVHPMQESCAVCGSSSLQLTGMGTQKLEELCRKYFPQARMARLDLDAVGIKHHRETILQQMRQGSLDILIGTQMVAKGLDFPNVSLVGVVDADALLGLPDYRAAERAAQLLLQVCGRAGRGEKTGEIVLQTFQPEHPLFQVLMQNRYLAFAGQELSLRAGMNYPPYTHLCRIIVRSKSETQGKAAIHELAERIVELLDGEEREFSLIGPAPCVIYQLQDEYRFQLFMRSQNRELLTSILRWLQPLIQGLHRKKIRFEPDLNPIQSL